jgi:hypothetical protein
MRLLLQNLLGNLINNMIIYQVNVPSERKLYQTSSPDEGEKATTAAEL